MGNQKKRTREQKFRKNPKHKNKKQNKKPYALRHRSALLALCRPRPRVARGRRAVGGMNTAASVAALASVRVRVCELLLPFAFVAAAAGTLPEWI